MLKQLQRARAQRLSRRTFLAGSTAGSLMLAYGGLAAVPSARAELQAGRFAPTVWFELNGEGRLLVNVAKAEMGQHVGTALARIVADELGADWEKVELAHVDTDPRWGYMVTGGSWSVFTSFTTLSQAGAAGRTVLVEAAAGLLGVSVQDCVAADGYISAGDQRIALGDIVARGGIDRQFTAEELAAMPIKTPAQRHLLGKPATAKDIPAKSNGTARYGIDAELPGMIYGRPLIPPTRYGSSVRAVDDSAAQAIAGYQGYEVIRDPSNTLQGWVVVLAEQFWAAKKAADLIKVDWEAGPTAGVNEDAILQRARELSAQDEQPHWVDEGQASGAGKRYEASYETRSALHFTLEPQNALAEFRDGKWHIHAGNQWQSLILPVLAAALEVPESDIVIHSYYLGGGFGRRLFGDYMLPAALAAKAVGKPVKLVLTREDDTRMDCLRSPSLQLLEARLGEDGQPLEWYHDVIAGWPTLTMAPSFMPDSVNGRGKVDPFSANGSNHWYTIPRQRVRAINNDLAQQTFLPGWLRAVGPGWIGWGVEGFMDELAHAAQSDPIDFRLRLLDGSGKNAGEAPNSVAGAQRAHAVLARAKVQAGWGRALPPNEGMGVALATGQERDMPTWIACIAHVRVDRDSGEMKVLKLWQTIDCGTVVHPDGALAQAEGASLWGVSLALYEGTRIENGEVVDLNLDRYTPLRMDQVPELDIRFVESGEVPTGMGEPPMIPVAPAIANAVFAATGVRLRKLPMRPEDFLAAEAARKAEQSPAA